MRAKHGMTLVELLTVVAIVGVLAALMLPAAQAAREAARRASCQNNLRQVGTALQVYHNAQGHLPIGCADTRVPRTNPAGRQLAWSAVLLPYMEQTPLWQQVDFDSAYDSAANSTAAREIVTNFICPSTVRNAPGREAAVVSGQAVNGTYRAAAIDYGGLYGAAQVAPSANGVFLYDRAVKLSDVSDGTSHTLAVAEDSGRGWLMNGEWINGENIFDVGGPPNTQQDNEMWSDHPGGAMALWCDGSVALVDESIELGVLRAVCTRAANDVAEIAR